MTEKRFPVIYHAWLKNEDSIWCMKNSQMCIWLKLNLIQFIQTSCSSEMETYFYKLSRIEKQTNTIKSLYLKIIFYKHRPLDLIDKSKKKWNSFKFHRQRKP